LASKGLREPKDVSLAGKLPLPTLDGLRTGVAGGVATSHAGFPRPDKARLTPPDLPIRMLAALRMDTVPNQSKPDQSTMRIHPLPLALCALIAAPLCHAAPAPVDLFNGKDFTGWTQRGGKAAYEIENGEIVGTSVLKTPNSFLCTEREYGDFILEYEFKVDPRLNSGVQIRSLCFDKAMEYRVNDKSIKVPAGRVHGYQVEIDPDVARKRMWSAGIFDEARRGWLFPAADDKEQQAAFSAKGMRVFKPEDWNHVRVEARGDRITTHLNGEPMADLKDSLTASGFIALQVHSIGNKDHEGTQVRWRNLKITDLDPPANTLSAEEQAAGWKLLWDGKTSDGWRGAKSDSFPAKGWEIKHGELTVLASGGAESASGGDIITRERFSDFELKLDFKMTPAANSGIKYFTQPNLNPITGSGAPAATGSAIGLEYQILDDARHPDAKNGRNGNRTLASLYDLMTADESKSPNSIGDWNHAHLIVRGNHVEHWLNGVKVLEYERGTQAFRDAVAASKYKTIPGFGEWADGHILLQDHGDLVSFRNIKIKTP
jgi:hypothetical protein